MANFSIVNTTGTGAGVAQAALGATYKTLILTGCSTTSTNTTSGGQLRRGKIYDILVGTNGTPADAYVEWDCSRVTMGTSSVGTAGISSVSSGLSIDLADNYGFQAMASVNSTGEGLYTATVEIWYVGVNQRASYRWVAAPGSELVYPANSSATGNNGLAVRARGSLTTTGTANILFQEQ